MYWSLQQPAEESESNPSEDSNTPDASAAASMEGDRETALASAFSNWAVNDAASDTADTSLSQLVENEESSEKVEGKDSPDRE